jgi:hypothetical protein
MVNNEPNDEVCDATKMIVAQVLVTQSKSPNFQVQRIFYENTGD